MNTRLRSLVGLLSSAALPAVALAQSNDFEHGLGGLAGSSAPSRFPWRWVILGVLVVLAVAAVYLRRRKGPPTP